MTNIIDLTNGYNGAGVYALVDEKGMPYIGSSVNVRKRLKEHNFNIGQAKIGNPTGFSNPKLDEASYRGEVFAAIVLYKLPIGAQRCSLREAERYYAALVGSIGDTYNCLKVGNRCLGDEKPTI